MTVGERVCASGDYYFITQVLAHRMDLVDQLLRRGVLVRAAALVPPLLQNFALRKLLLEDSIGLLQGVPKIGYADIQHSVRRQQRKDFARIPRTRCLDSLQFRAELGEFREQSQLVIQIAAPSNLLANGHHADAL